MTYHLIGAGNMARFLLRRLTAAGYSCAGIWNRTAVTGRDLARIEGVPHHSSLAGINDGANLCILAIPDDAIAEVAAKLSFRHTVLLHTSGATPAGVLSPGAQHYGVLWPVYSIRNGDIPEHKLFPVLWSGSTTIAKSTISSVASTLGTPTQESDDDARRMLHLAAVFGNNFINHILAIAQQLCNAGGQRWSLLQPLIQQTVEGAATMDAQGLQTGPALRRDQTTLDRHLNMLKERPDWAAVYALLSRSIASSVNQGEPKP